MHYGQDSRQARTWRPWRDQYVPDNTAVASHSPGFHSLSEQQWKRISFGTKRLLLDCKLDYRDIQRARTVLTRMVLVRD